MFAPSSPQLMIQSVLIGLSLMVLLAPSVCAADEAADEDALWSQVRVVLQSKCVRCHGDEVHKAELDLRSPESIFRGGESGAAIDDEHPHDSLLLEYVNEGLMPPEDEGTLSDTEVRLINRWVRQEAALSAERQDAQQVTQHDVLPILLLRCAACHGRQTPQGQLDVRSRASLIKGGKSGPAIVPGRPDDSRLLQRIHAGEMPPRKDLVRAAVKPMAPHEIQRVTRWIAAGAPEVDIEPDVMTSEPDPLVSDQERQFWAFQPPTAAEPPDVQHAELVRTPIDAFILRQLEARQLTLSPAADRRTLIRRASFDLLGLPPTPNEVEAFVTDESPNAWGQLIDRLLESPRYGERWGQHWLDLAGYSDSEGVQHADVVRKHAWRYRDYVIRAFNSDKPYDRFLQEQLAGDELADYESASEITPDIYDNLVATGFLRLAPDGTYEPLTGFVPDRLELIDDNLEILSSSIMGLTIKCARCHSHKFDPIPQRDYYRLAAIFKGALDEHDWLKPTSRKLPYVMAEETQEWKESGGRDEDRPQIRALWDRGEPSPTYILKRGNYLTTGREVGPGVPSVLTDGKTPLDVQPPWPESDKTGRRLALARWLTQKDHPLTSRVLVNRVWKHHFGRGIVETLDNFGTAGARPTHPQLLDWLAVQFVEGGWSIKTLHRTIMNSAVYRQTSDTRPEHESRDPDNRLLSRMSLARMDGEVVRDSLLFIAGQLDLTPFGPPDPVEAREDGLVTSSAVAAPDRWRRSIYLLRRRTQPVTLLQNFDVGRMDPNCVERSESIVAPQALHLKNNRWVYNVAGAFSRRVLEQAGDDPEEQIRIAWQLMAGRLPTDEEREASNAALTELRHQRQEQSLGTRHEFAATRHLWIREIEPERVFEDDLVSVWSSQSTDKGRRWGLLEFDVSSLAELSLTQAHLQLGVINSDPIQQLASVIPHGIDNYNWSLFHQHKAAHLTPLDGLGRMKVPAGESGVEDGYQSCQGATPDDLRLLSLAVEDVGRLTLVLQADETGDVWRRDWDDGVHSSTQHRPPQLVVYDARPDPQQASREALHDFCHGLINSAAFLYID